MSWNSSVHPYPIHCKIYKKSSTFPFKTTVKVTATSRSFGQWCRCRHRTYNAIGSRQERIEYYLPSSKEEEKQRARSLSEEARTSTHLRLDHCSSFQSRTVFTHSQNALAIYVFILFGDATQANEEKKQPKKKKKKNNHKAKPEG